MAKSDRLTSLDRKVFHITKYVFVDLGARHKAWVNGRSLAEIAASNPAGDMDVCLL